MFNEFRIFTSILASLNHKIIKANFTSFSGQVYFLPGRCGGGWWRPRGWSRTRQPPPQPPCTPLWTTALRTNEFSHHDFRFNNKKKKKNFVLVNPSWWAQAVPIGSINHSSAIEMSKRTYAVRGHLRLSVCRQCFLSNNRNEWKKWGWIRYFTWIKGCHLHWHVFLNTNI